MNPARTIALDSAGLPCLGTRDDLPHTASRRLPPGASTYVHGARRQPRVKTWRVGQHGEGSRTARSWPPEEPTPPTTLTESPHLELTVPARAENVGVVRHALGGLAEVLNVDDQALSDIRLAVTEACTNVVVHAYPERDGPLHVSALLDGEERLTVIVRDEGRGIVPRPDSPGLGLGLPLIATLTEALELSTDEEEHTEVRMIFRLAAGQDDQ